MDLLAHWQLRERPFEATWDTRYFFASTEHQEAVDRLLYLVGETSMYIGMLSGEIGCGKTLTRAAFAERLLIREAQSESPPHGLDIVPASITKRESTGPAPR